MSRNRASRIFPPRILAYVAGVLALTVSSGMAPAAPPSAITFQHDGIEALFPDERDAGFLRALQLIPGRLEEISSHPNVGDELANIPPEVFPMAGAVFMDPVRFILTIDGLDEETGFPKFGAVIRFDDADRDGGPIGRGVAALERHAPLPLEFHRNDRYSRMVSAETMFGPLTYGARQRGGEWGWEVHFGAVTDPEEWLDSEVLRPEIPGAVAGWSVDFSALTPATRSLVGMLNLVTPGQNLAREAVQAGLLGEKAISVSMVMGFESGRSYTTMRSKGARAYADELGLVQETLRESDLEMVPGDATAGVISRIDPMRSWAAFREQLAKSGQGGEIDWALAQFERSTGVDFEEDLLASLGGTMMMYFSDSTGGGSLFSGVIGLRLSDPAEFDRSMERLTEAAMRHLEEESDMDGLFAVRFAKHQSGPRGFTTFRIDGLPLPVEPTLGRIGDWAVLALSPNAAHGALGQDEGSSILRSGILGRDWSGGEELVSLSFVDSGRTIRDGYPALNLMLTSMAGFVRSSGDTSRDPGTILPPYSELMKDATPFIVRSFWDGEDFVVHATADRSRLVHAAALLGVADLGSVVAGALTGSAITAGIFGARDAGAFGDYEYEEEIWESPAHEHDQSDEPGQRDVPY